MKVSGIQAKRKRKFVVTPIQGHNYPIVPIVLYRDFTVTRPGQIWVSDIPYIKTSNGWLYITVIIDLFDRKVVGLSRATD